MRNTRNPDWWDIFGPMVLGACLNFSFASRHSFDWLVVCPDFSKAVPECHVICTKTWHTGTCPTNVRCCRHCPRTNYVTSHQVLRKQLFQWHTANDFILISGSTSTVTSQQKRTVKMNGIDIWMCQALYPWYFSSSWPVEMEACFRRSLGDSNLCYFIQLPGSLLENNLQTTIRCAYGDWGKPLFNKEC